MSESSSPAGSPADLDRFFDACAAGDVGVVREAVGRKPGLATARHHGATGLHAAAGHPEVLRVLLDAGADPNARDEGDDALPLHFAAGGGPIESVRLLLDAGSDVQGEGDAHRLDVIGWATAFAEARRDVVDLLVERGARHHAFSAIAMGDPNLVRRVVEDDARALERRMSPLEGEQTALHYVVAPPDGLLGGTFRNGEHYATLGVLIELGADLEATDANGRTALALAMLRGDSEAMRILHEAGARIPDEPEPAPVGPDSVRHSVGRIEPMLPVADMRATIEWYEAIGFALAGSHGEDGRLDWARLAFGDATLMIVPATDRVPAASGISLWIETDRLDELYAALRARRMARARAELEGREPEGPEIRFSADLYTAFYGQREFGLPDPNGIEVMFAQTLQPGAQ